MMMTIVVVCLCVSVFFHPVIRIAFLWCASRVLFFIFIIFRPQSFSLFSGGAKADSPLAASFFLCPLSSLRSNGASYACLCVSVIALFVSFLFPILSFVVRFFSVSLECCAVFRFLLPRSVSVPLCFVFGGCASVSVSLSFLLYSFLLPFLSFVVRFFGVHSSVAHSLGYSLRGLSLSLSVLSSGGAGGVPPHASYVMCPCSLPSPRSACVPLSSGASWPQILSVLSSGVAGGVPPPPKQLHSLPPYAPPCHAHRPGPLPCPRVCFWHPSHGHS